MNSRLRWRSLTRAWTLPVTRSIPASRLTVPCRLYSMLAGKGRVHAGLRRQIGGGRSDRVNAWLLVVRDDRHSIARVALREGRRLFQKFHLAINAQHLRHFFRGVAALQIVTDFVRLYVFLVEDFADRALHQVRTII